jgi:glycosyltransferase involved in cell wall biosynthesis
MSEPIAIITPCFNENHTVIRFLEQLEETLSHLPHNFTVVVVDDCSTDDTLALLLNFAFRAQNLSLHVLSLEFNLGHQGAIYQGLLHGRMLASERFVVMDSDGEDDPRAIIDLAMNDTADIVHVVRGKRSEGILFQVAYYFYQVLFRMITRQHMNFGNYCMINRKVLNATLHTSFIHFAAYLSKLKVRHAYVTYDRQKRLGGRSKMRIDSLVAHAFKSLTEHAESLLLVFLKVFFVLASSFMGVILYILYQKLFTDNAILGWASTISVGLFHTALIAIGFYVLGILLLNIAHHRNQSYKKPIFQRMSLTSEPWENKEINPW